MIVAAALVLLTIASIYGVSAGLSHYYSRAIDVSTGLFVGAWVMAIAAGADWALR